MATAENTVAAIDISLEGLRQANEEATRQGQRQRIHALRMDGERLAFGDATFDLICGSAILHHLDVRLAYTEIARVMKPSGTAVFMEPLGHNPIINTYRRFTPELRTRDEHPLTAADLALAHAYFESVEVRYYHLCTLATILLVGTPFAAPALRLLLPLDELLFRNVVSLRRFAWYAILVLQQPRVPV